MQISRKIGEKGQVVIPEQIRRETGMTPGTVVLFDIEDGNITVRKQKDDVEAFHQLLKGIPNEKRRKFDIGKAIDAQYEERFRGMMGKK